jgi:putative transposase
MSLARSTFYYRPRRAAADKTIVQKRIAELCAEFPRDGYRRITRHLRAEGTIINHKAVARLMRESGLQVRPVEEVRDHD